MRLLLVEDNADLRHLLALECALFDIDVVAVAGYDDAIVALRDGRFDVLVTDRFLDDGDGEALARWSPVPAIVTSGAYTGTERDDAGFLRLPKPFRPDDLVAIAIEMIGATEVLVAQGHPRTSA